MSVQFAMLASGSRGNSALVQAGGSALLVDVGLGPKTLAQRLESVGSTWDRVRAVLLTHTHGDHVSQTTLRWMARRGVVLYCQAGHRPALADGSGFRDLEQNGLIREYDEQPFLTPAGWRIEPLPLWHDGPTFGFRIEGKADRRSPCASIGYLADTGCWTDSLAEALADVDLLAVEFNHDEDLQRRSGRSYALIARNLGDRGHLSNRQGAALLSAVLGNSRPGAVRQVVLLHLSQQCNRPDLALSTARAALRRSGRRATLHAALQDAASPDLLIRPARRRSVAAPAPAPAAPGFPWEADGSSTSYLPSKQTPEESPQFGFGA